MPNDGPSIYRKYIGSKNDVSAIIYSAIGGGGGALIGVLLFFLFQKMRRKDVASEDRVSTGVKGGLVGGLAVAGGLFVGAVYKNMTLPRIFPMDDTEIAQSLPVLVFIKTETRSFAFIKMNIKKT